MTPEPSEYLMSDQEMRTQWGISKSTLVNLIASAPADAPPAFMHIGCGVRRPRRRWWAHLVWPWLKAVRAHLESIPLPARPAAKSAPKVRRTATSANSAEPDAPKSLRSLVLGMHRRNS